MMLMIITLTEIMKETSKQFEQKIKERIEELEKECKEELTKILELNPDYYPEDLVPNRTKVEIIKELKSLLENEK